MQNVDVRTAPPSPVMRWLAAGLPLSLLFDLMSPHGPNSLEILLIERAHTSCPTLPTGPAA